MSDRISIAQYRALAKPMRAKARALPRGEMNAGEREYAAHLDLRKLAGQIVDWRFEPMTLHLGARLSLRVDFLIIERDGTLTFDDYKAVWRGSDKPHVEDDARAKMKMAARLFPWFRFRYAYKRGTKAQPIWSAVEVAP
jgi:hypothetical protein